MKFIFQMPDASRRKNGDRDPATGERNFAYIKNWILKFIQPGEVIWVRQKGRERAELLMK